MSAPGLDTRILLALNWCARTRSAPLFSFLSANGLFLFGIIGLALFLRTRTRAEGDGGRTTLLAWFSAGLIAEDIVKPLIRSPRPTGNAVLRPQLFVLGTAPGPKSLGMPSGTAAMCFAAALCIWIYFGRRAGIAAFLAATLIAASRVVAGVHWPTDVLVGALVGLLTGFGFYQANLRVNRATSQR